MTTAQPASGAANVLVLDNVSRIFGDDGGLFQKRSPRVQALGATSLQLKPRETVALVGESGSGKTTLGRIAALLDQPTSGRVLINGIEANPRRTKDRFALLRQVQMIFQDPFASLNPRRTVGDSIAEPLIIHGIGNKPIRQAKVLALLQQVGLPPESYNRYPHQFSGGQRQRIAIARALALDPAIIVADEAVSALDVSIQAQIINLLREIQTYRNLAILFITHDLAVARHIADRIVVMYLGRIVEEGETEALFDNPAHPYTRALLAATPKLGRGKRSLGQALAGEPPSPLSPPPGCAFQSRCPLAMDRCLQDRPHLAPTQNHAGKVACFAADREGQG